MQVQLVLGKDSKGNLIKAWEVRVVIEKLGERRFLEGTNSEVSAQGGVCVLRKYLGIGVLVSSLIICMAAQVRPEQLDRGGEWLSWSPEQRITYVNGFITGYLQGSHTACEAADELFEIGKPHRLGDAHGPSKMPSARCLARMQTYSKARYTRASGPDFSAYANVITEFYTKHPGYQGIPFVDLMKWLSDRNYKTEEELYAMALRGELRPAR